MNEVGMLGLLLGSIRSHQRLQFLHVIRERVLHEGIKVKLGSLVHLFSLENLDCPVEVHLYAHEWCQEGSQ